MIPELAAFPLTFRSKVEQRDDGCWHWIAGSNGKGYGCWAEPTGEIDGKGNLRYRKLLPHRVTYERLVGPIPRGKVLDHLCRNRRCCNPAHLEPKTNRANILCGEGVSARNARKTHCPQGHEYDKLTRKGYKRCRTCDRAQDKAYKERLRARRKEDQYPIDTIPLDDGPPVMPQ